MTTTEKITSVMREWLETEKNDAAYREEIRKERDRQMLAILDALTGILEIERPLYSLTAAARLMGVDKRYLQRLVTKGFLMEESDGLYALDTVSQAMAEHPPRRRNGRETDECTGEGASA